MDYVIDHGEMSDKQLSFCRSKKKRIGYGGARGGGKTHVLCHKATDLAMKIDGVRILIIRRSFPELQKEIVPKLISILGDLIKAKIVKYNTTKNEFGFPNGSTIILGHYATELNSIDYQGLNIDIIFMDEATQFTESMYRVLTLCNRLSGRVDLNKYPSFQPRMYFTCNPGGVGHVWFKKLFIDRVYSEGENPDDYEFIPCTVFENKYLMDNDPTYINNLKALPEKQRLAMLYGDWEVFQGQFFEEFDEAIHTYDPDEVDENGTKVYEMKPEWRLYRTRDYGLDMLACYLCYMDEDGFFYIDDEIVGSDLPVSKSGNLINARTPKDRTVYSDICPPDMWNRNRDTGKSSVDILIKECGQYPTKANNDREMGWLMLKEMLMIDAKRGVPRLRINKKRCPRLIESLKMIQHDENKPNDCAKEPHDITHYPDAVRYLCTSYTFAPERVRLSKPKEFDIGAFAVGMYDDDKESEDTSAWGFERVGIYDFL